MSVDLVQGRGYSQISWEQRRVCWIWSQGWKWPETWQEQSNHHFQYLKMMYRDLRSRPVEEGCWGLGRPGRENVAGNSAYHNLPGAGWTHARRSRNVHRLTLKKETENTLHLAFLFYSVRGNVKSGGYSFIQVQHGFLSKIMYEMISFYYSLNRMVTILLSQFRDSEIQVERLSKLAKTS